MATAKLLDDITMCPICTEVYTDPRVLPCVHTYCLKCIEAWSKDKQPGDKLACPLCRKEITLSGNGVRDLPKNFFVANFLQMKELSSVESKTSPCEACSGNEESESEVQNVASVYCVECQMKLCQICGRAHKKVKLTRMHKLVEIGQQMNAETLYQSMPPSYCNQHQDKCIEIYCFECKMAICMMCYIELHNNHKCTDVNKVGDDFRKRMASDGDSIAAGVEKCREMLENLDTEKNVFGEQVAKAEIEISEKAEQLKQMIDDHKEKLMTELSSMKQRRMKEIESLHEEIERQLLSMESYKKYVDEVRQKGTACDVARAASGLHDRADELLMFDVIERTLADLGHADVTYSSSNFVVDDTDKTIGQLSMRVIRKVVPRLKHVIRYHGGGSVSAVTTLGDDVFVVRFNSQQVEVYDAETFKLQRCIAVPGLGRDTHGMAACRKYNCLYLSDHGNDSIHRVELSGCNAVKKWSVASNPAGLSVNDAHNLVVACFGANKVQQYTSHGTPVREKCMQKGVTRPWHAVQLSSGNYAVSQRRSQGVVSVVGLDGEVVHRYGLSQTPDVGHMKNPTNLAVAQNDNILVNDQDNERILSIDTSSGCLQELDLFVKDEIQEPRGLCLDESRDRLYVGEWCGEYRVLVFDGVRL